ncbi:MAG: hypothetical protein SFT94_01060 [Pseudanabaenaceae cyanobacterium bins.68]|nr:hypothetical protein [Pseudanabaenaceae cyanobacterium bins.68]
MPPIDLEAIAAFLTPSLQQTLGAGFEIETYQLENCLLIKLIADQVLPQPQVLTVVERDLSQFKLSGIDIIRVANWYLPPRGEQIMLWSQDILKYHQIELNSSEPTSIEPEFRPVQTAWRGRILLTMVLVAIATSIGGIVKLATSNDFQPSTSVAPVASPPPVPPATPPRPAAKLPVFTARPTSTPRQPEINRSQYNQIQVGMELPEVEQIIGKPGRLIYDNPSSVIPTQLYSWKNPDGSNAIIEFQEGKVASKNQAGL